MNVSPLPFPHTSLPSPERVPHGIAALFRFFHSHALRRAFSMVEVLAAVAIMGVIAFMAIPSVTKMRGDSERNLAIARAEALNIAQASFMQAEGRSRAELQWLSATSPAAKYALLRPYLAFSDDTLTRYMPSSYSVTFSNSIVTMQKCTLAGPSGVIRY
jgi:prepilin-type N-terminal cleavage/methylation domain-containing protein